jgi:hypothetical protein
MAFDVEKLAEREGQAPLAEAEDKKGNDVTDV